MFHKVNSVSPLESYHLLVHFWDGTSKIYDVNPLFDKWPRFNELKQAGEFDEVRVDLGGYGVVWNDRIDLSCDELWENGQPTKTPFDDIVSFADASMIWGLNESTLRKAVAYGKFVDGIDICKYGKQWLITMTAMRREYGEPRKG